MDDGYDLTMFGLLRKRAYLAGEIEVHRDKLAALMADIDHLDATIRIFDPDADIADDVKRPPPIYAAFRGELSRFLLNDLKRATAPVPTFDLARGVMKARGMSDKDKAALVIMARKVSHAMRKMVQKGYVQCERTKPGAQMQWWITPAGQVTEKPGGWRNATTVDKIRTEHETTISGVTIRKPHAI